MTRGVALFLVGSVVLITLAACGRSWLEERAPWRHQAEVECLKSGAVKESPTVTALSPIDGPGTCGADFPLKVSALGSGQALGFADDPRPPGAIPQYYPAAATPQTSVAPYRPPAPYPPAPYPHSSAAPGAPMPLGPPDGGPQQLADDQQPPPRGAPVYGAAPRPYDPEPEASRGSQLLDRSPFLAGPPSPVPLGPARGLAPTAGPVNVMPVATLACPLVSALDNWVTNGIQPAALRWFGQPVVEIKQISAYSCRTMNGQRGTPISEHAFGNALDVAAFTLADGRKVTVRDGWHGQPAERAFLHDVQASACQLFATVLAPGSNAFHYDHIHVDLARHASGRSICRPAPIPGDLIARRSEPGTTGGLGGHRIPRGWTQPDEDRSDASPGED